MDEARSTSTRVIAQYKLAAPGGSWEASDDGIYTVSVLPDQVRDFAGNATTARSAGTLTVAIA